MNTLNTLYREPLGLFTDLYEMTMAAGYWKAGMAERRAVFHLFFRRHPFGAGFALAAGLDYAIEFLNSFRLEPSDLEYLSTLTGTDGTALFEPAFLDYLAQLRFDGAVYAVPEGTVVFAQEPLLRIEGSLLFCQLVETFLINVIGFQTLVATKAARIKAAACGEPVVEFGLRRAQGIDGGIAASRAAYIGGCDATSNLLAGKMFGIPVRGTHAHSWVMSFDDELAAFREYARAMPHNCVFLVDTYDTLQGVHNAVKAAEELRSRGASLVGIRLDSGDLAYLSKEARRLLDEAGLEKAAIMASNDLDEHIITSLKIQGAKINVWGVGTKLVTAYEQPALGAVYKLSAVHDAKGLWKHKLKVSEQTAKSTLPGRLQVRRFKKDGESIADAIYDEFTGIEPGSRIVDPADVTRSKRIPADASGEDLLVPVFAGGKCVYNSPALQDIRLRAASQLESFHEGIKRFVNPHQYPAGVEERLSRLRTELILREREKAADPDGGDGGSEAGAGGLQQNNRSRT